MKKRILVLLLGLCMAVSLISNAKADTVSATVTLAGKTLTVNAHNAPAYSVNTCVVANDTGGNTFTAITQEITDDVNNWNAKLVWNAGDTVPTLYLKNFIVDEYNEQTQKWKDTKTTAISFPTGQPMKIVIAADSQIKTRFGITYGSNLEIQSEGGAKLNIWNLSSAISSGAATGCALTLDANLELYVGSYYDTNSHILQTNQADLTVNGGNIKISTDDDHSVLGMVTRGSGNILINGGNLDVTSSIGAAPSNGTIQSADRIVIDGGTVKATAKHTTALYAKNGIAINGGSVDISTPYYGINAGAPDAPADITINGGTVKITANRAFFTYPVLGEGVFAYAGADEASAKSYDGSTPMAKEPWMLISNDPQQLSTEPTEAPTVSPTEATAPAPTKPTEAPAKRPYINPYLLYWFAAAGAMGLVGIGVTLIAFRRKNPNP